MMCRCNPFCTGLALGFVGGLTAGLLLAPKPRRLRTGPGRAMEAMSGQVDRAVRRIHCVLAK